MAKSKYPIFETMSNTYTVEQPLGEGGVGKVFEVRDLDGNIFALKFFTPLVVTTDKLKRFKNEMVFLSKNRHDNVVPVSDTGFVTDGDKKLPFYVMPRYQSTLRKLMDERVRPEDILYYFSQILNGLEALHMKGVWHRDLKPENILFDEDNKRLLIADLGVAHFCEDELHTLVETKPAARMANFLYAAPEQRVKGGQVSHLADIFALGLILNELFTGDVRQGTGHRTIGDISPNHAFLDELVNLMIQQAPENRIGSLDAIKRELIGREQTQIERQKLSQLENHVVPAYELDDPLAVKPVEIENIDYQNGTRYFFLNQPVNDNWSGVFRNPDFNISHPMGYGPANFSIKGSTILINAPADLAVRISEFVTGHIPRVTARYLYHVKDELAKNENRERAALQAEVSRKKKEAETRDQVRRSLGYA